MFQDISQTFSNSTLYGRFVNELFDQDLKITFITLNYDLLLDYAIEVATGKKFSSLKSYFEQQEKWIEFKLHGSVDWYHRITTYSQKEAPIIGKAFEPTEGGYTEAQLHALYSSNPIVLRGVDDARFACGEFRTKSEI